MKLIQQVLLLFVFSCVSGQRSQDFMGFNFAHADSIAMNAGIDLKDLKTTVQALTHTLENDAEKFRAIYRWIANTVSYDTKLYHKNKAEEKKLRFQKDKLKRWKEKFGQTLTRRLIKNRSSICSGYSWLLNGMCELAGIQTVIIEGYSKTEISRIGVGKIDHAWNAVKLNQKWYLCDPTWSAGFCDPNVKLFTRKFDENYFLTDPDYFIAQHYPKDKSWTLKFNSPSLVDFLKAPIKMEGYFQNQMVHNEPSAGYLKIGLNTTRQFLFRSNAANIQRIDASLIKRNSVIETKSLPISKNTDGYYTIDYLFSKKGYYQLVISVNKIPSIMYEVSISGR